MIKRLLDIELPQHQSAFLWGARKTGKSTYLHERFADSICYDLLKTDELTRLMAAPHRLREELLAMPAERLQQPIIIDEIQKVPMLLNEVHWLIENKKLSFILCGSSARKLKRGAANLLGGRAWRFNFYPLVYQEIIEFDLLRALNHGLLPSHYLSDQPQRMLRAYLADYLKEEIQAEGIVRNFPGFARFIELAGFCNAQMLNYTNIARDCAIDSKTVKEYFQILQDTLVGYLIDPFAKKIKRDLISSTPKFYWFDVGVANYLSKSTIQSLQGSVAGNAFEHFILMELIAFLGIHEMNESIQYWRSKTGLEVDFILNRGDFAIEVKISENPNLSDLKGLRAFCNDYKPKHAIVICCALRRRLITTENDVKIEAIPWQEFLQELWDRKYI
ncbi:MAG: AAA family ATPase [Gammaproteobacteria bacterium]|nr:AAA family ATPase [Gammaproteobacteria bacterium]